MSAPPDPYHLPLQPRPYYALKHAVQRAQRLTARPAPWRGLRLLGYHRISDDRDELATSPERFRGQMAMLAGSRFRVVSLDAGLDALADGDDAPSVAVTFDDGYLDNLEHAMPVLRELGVPATIFVVSGAVDGRIRLSWYRRQPPLLSWGELRALAAEGLVSLGSHTRTHPALPRVDEPRARDEIVGSRAEIERRAGCRVSAFCYPAGRYGPRELALVAAAGYRIGVTCEPGTNDAGTPPVELRRTLIDRRDDLAAFAAKLDGALDRPLILRGWLHARRSRPAATGR